MPFEYIPLLAKQLELYTLPRGLERFQTYLRTIVNETGDEVTLAPLVAMNPMGREHCNALLEQYLAPELDAERLAQETLAAFSSSSLFRVSLVLIDDAKGGWTNRTDCEYKARLASKPLPGQPPWITVGLWTSAPACRETVVEALHLAVSRTLYQHEYGTPKTLADLLAQEAATAPPHPPLDPDELAYTQSVLAPLLETSVDNMPVIVAALFGDTAAVSLGYPPLGLSDNAGLRLAVQDSARR